MFSKNSMPGLISGYIPFTRIMVLFSPPSYRLSNSIPAPPSPWNLSVKGGAGNVQRCGASFKSMPTPFFFLSFLVPMALSFATCPIARQRIHVLFRRPSYSLYAKYSFLDGIRFLAKKHICVSIAYSSFSGRWFAGRFFGSKIVLHRAVYIRARIFLL